MKKPSTVLFWNIWGHRNPRGIHEYIARHQNVLDVCCLTEVTSMRRPYDPVPQVHANADNYEPPSFLNGREQLLASFGDRFDIEYASPHFDSWTCAVTGKIYDEVGFGSALLIRKGLRTIETGSRRILHGVDDVRPRILQHIAYEVAGMRTLVVHLHGVWLRYNTKGDDPVRDLQTRCILENVDRIAHEHAINRVIFGGDLNLDIGTRAIAEIERGHGVTRRFRNLIREKKIAGTRTPSYRKFGMPEESLHADYVFVTQNIQVHRLDVDTAAVASDHAPLQLSFN